MSFAGKKNVYLCEACGHGFVTLDVDEGVTPMLTKCINGSCAGTASSLFYKVPQDWLKTPALDWFRPSPEHAAALGAGTQEHVAKGGLIIRPHVRQE